MIRLFAPLLLAALTLPIPAEGQVEFRANETDEFTGFRRIATEHVQVEVQEQGNGSPLNNTATVSVAYMKDGERSGFGLILGALTDSWSFRDAETAYFLVDGKRFESSARMLENLSEKKPTGIIFEFTMVGLGANLLSAISNASKVRMQINGYEFDITEAVDDEIEAVRREARK